MVFFVPLWPMSNNEIIYLELLRAGLWNRPAVIDDAVDWKSVIALARHQSTCGPVFQAAMALEESADLPPKALSAMQTFLLKTVNAHAATNHTIATIAKAFQAEGIDPVLLKGQGVAACYPQPLLRQCGDIDLYVGKKDYEAACRIAEQFRTAGAEADADDTYETDKHFSFSIGGGLEVEIHRYTEVLDEAKKNAVWQSISDTGTTTNLVPMTFEDVTVQTPNDDFNALYIFHHMWHHVIGMGLGLRQLCDWTMFLHSRFGKLDTALLWQRLVEMKLTDVWRVFGCLSVQHLGLPAEEMPFYNPSYNRRAHRLLHYLLTEGDNREFKFGRSSATLRKKAATLRYLFRKYLRMLPIFPGIATRTFLRSMAGGMRKFKAKR